MSGRFRFLHLSRWFARLRSPLARNLPRPRLAVLRGPLWSQLLRRGLWRFKVYRRFFTSQLGTLAGQLSLLTTTVMFLLIGVNYLVQFLVVMPAFDRLEREGAQRNAGRCVDAIHRDLDHLSSQTNDWAAWDDAYEFVAGKNPRFEQTTLKDESLGSAAVNLLGFLTPDGKPIWSKVLDLETLQPVDVPDIWTELAKPDGPFLRYKDVNDAKDGILLTSQGPMLLSVRPIITSERKGPVRGSLVMGRFLDNSKIRELGKLAHVKLEGWSVREQDLPGPVREILPKLVEEGQSAFGQADERELHAYTRVNDFFGNPAVVLRINVPREVTAEGAASARLAATFGLIGGMCLILAVWIILRRRLVLPLQSLAAFAKRVGQNDDLGTLLGSKRRDEIGALAREFDRMVEKLAISRKKLAETAQRAGMADVAGEVLHNVGNVMNSANSSLQTLEQGMLDSKVSGLLKAAKMLKEQAPRASEFFATDPRAPKLIDYIDSVSETLRLERERNQKELARLRDAVRHIRCVIAAQQSHAKGTKFRIEVGVQELVEESIRLLQEEISRAGITLAVELPSETLTLYLNKIKMSQVLVNLVRNSVDALEASDAPTKIITVSARIAGDGAVELDVRDNGLGFSKEIASQLFTQGFSTKASGGNGIGLHFCANAVKSEGGEIRAFSDGPGAGALFRIRLPLSDAKSFSKSPDGQREFRQAA